MAKKGKQQTQKVETKDTGKTKLVQELCTKVNNMLNADRKPILKIDSGGKHDNLEIVHIKEVVPSTVGVGAIAYGKDGLRYLMSIDDLNWLIGRKEFMTSKDLTI